MNQLEFAQAGLGDSQADAILRKLEAHQGHWVSMPDLCHASGSYNAHSRISDLRKRGYRIEQRSERHANSRTVHSFYRIP